MSASQRDPLTVVTQDGSTWWKRAVDQDGHGLYARGDSTEACPTLRTIRQLAEFGLKSMPAVTADPEPSELERLRVQVAELLAERHTTNEALSDAAEALRVGRDREAIVAKFVAARAEYITSIRNCHPDNGHDYDRWQGHAAARRQLAQELGLPVAWPSEDAAAVGKSVSRLQGVLAPSDGEHYASVHHRYELGRDLPQAGGVQ